jgi:ABC-type multidrug transport system ATPase subunit
MPAAIETEDLTKHYGRTIGVEGLTLRVDPGEVFGFLGANGAGKTTTIRLLLDLMRPTRGRARLNGYDSRVESLAARATVGYLPGAMPLYPELTGAGYLRFLASLEGRAVDPSIAGKLLRRFQLGDAELSRRMTALSHGTKRKFGIVQALIGDAPLLVLDEPTSGLDPLMIEAFAETIEELRGRGRTIFLSSHVLAEVEKLCDRIALIAAGRLVTVSALADIRRTLPRRVRVLLSAAAPVPESLRRYAADVRVTDREWNFSFSGPAGPIVAALSGVPIADLDIRTPTLEEYILGLYGRERP